MDLTIYFEEIVRHFSRYHKYTLGTELREKSREIVGLIIKANSTRERQPLLLNLRDKLEGLKVFARIYKEVKAFHRFNSYVFERKLIKLSLEDERIAYHGGYPITRNHRS